MKRNIKWKYNKKRTKNESSTHRSKTNSSKGVASTPQHTNSHPCTRPGWSRSLSGWSRSIVWDIVHLLFVLIFSVFPMFPRWYYLCVKTMEVLFCFVVPFVLLSLCCCSSCLFHVLCFVLFPSLSRLFFRFKQHDIVLVLLFCCRCSLSSCLYCYMLWSSFLSFMLFFWFCWFWFYLQNLH